MARSRIYLHEKLIVADLKLMVHTSIRDLAVKNLKTLISHYIHSNDVYCEQTMLQAYSTDTKRRLELAQEISEHCEYDEWLRSTTEFHFRQIVKSLRAHHESRISQYFFNNDAHRDLDPIFTEHKNITLGVASSTLRKRKREHKIKQ